MWFFFCFVLGLKSLGYEKLFLKKFPNQEFQNCKKNHTSKNHRVHFISKEERFPDYLMTKYAKPLKRLYNKFST